MPLYIFVYLYYNHDNFEHMQNYIILITAYILSTIIISFENSKLIIRFSSLILEQSIKLGGLSYGLYIIHYPILKIFSYINIFSGHWYTFLASFALFIGTSLIAAYFLEKKLQPKVRSITF